MTDGIEARLRELETECEALRRQLAQAEAMQAISRALTSTLDLQQVLTLILELAGRVIAYDSASVLLVTPDRNGVTIVAGRGFQSGDAMIGRSFSFEEGNISAQVIAGQQTMLVDDVQQHPGWGHRRVDLEGTTTIRAWIGAPLVVDGESIGLVTFDKHTPGFYSAQDAQAASAFAAQAALAVRNARLFEETRRRAEEMTVLQQIGLDLASRTETLEAVLAAVLERVRHLFHAENGEIWLWDEVTGLLELVTYQAGGGLDMRGARLRPGEGFNGRVFVSGEPMILDDYATWPHRLEAWQGVPQHATMGVAMVWQGRRIGTLTVGYAGPTRRFGAQDVRLLGLFAHHAAAAIANARLLDETRRRLMELEALHEIGRAISSTMQLEALLELIYHQTGRLMDTTNFYIAFYDPTRHWIDFAFEVEARQRLPRRGRAFADGLTEYILKTREPLFLPSAAMMEEVRHSLGLQPHGRPARSWLGVPLVAGDQAIGVMAVQSYERDYAYDMHDRRVLAMIAAQAAIAVHNARLYEIEQQRVKELELKQRQLATILRVGDLLRADLSLENILQRVAQAALEATGFRVAMFSLVEGHPPVLRRVAAAGLAPDVLAEVQKTTVDFRVAQNLMRDEFRIGQSYFLPHERNRELIQGLEVIVTMPEPTEWELGQWHPDDALFTPLRDRAGRVLGVLSVDDPADGRRPTQATIEILEIFANQASAAVQNARLYQAAHEQAARLTLINRVAAQTTSTLALDELLNTAARSIREAFGYQDVGVLLVEGEELVLRAAAGHTFEKLAGQFRIQVGSGLTGWAVVHRQTIIVGDTQGDPRYLAVEASTRSEVVVPLMAADQVLGVLNVESAQPYAFKDDDVMGLETIANQLAGAITNARLYAETQRRAEELRHQKAEIELLYRVASELSATLDATTLLEHLLPMATATIGATYGSVFLLDEGGNITHFLVTRPAVTGVEVKTVAQIVLDRGLAGWVYKHAQPVLLTDAQNDPRWFRLPNAPYEPAGSVLCVPLNVRGVVRGVLTLVHPEPGYLTGNHLRTLVAIAQQAATALENIDLYERERKRAEQFALLHRVAATISSSLDIEEVLRVAAARLMQSFGVDHCGMVLFDPDLTYGHLLAEYPVTGIVGLRFPLGEDKVESELIRTKAPVYIGNVDEDPRLGAATRATLQCSGMVSTLLVPLVVRDRIIGSFGLDVKKERTFSAEEVELGQTIAAQIAVAVENARLYEQSVTRVEQEMAIAQQIQRNLFPRDVPHLTGWEVAATCRPARETGGDFYEFVVLEDRQLGIIIGDVSGKGLPAAMLMAAARSTARAMAYAYPTPAQVLNKTNRLLCDDVPAGAFVAMSYALLDLPGGRMGASNGGQVLPLIVSPAGQITYMDLPPPKLPLGMWPDLQYGDAWRELAPGDTVLFITDGVLEAHNPQGELFGLDAGHRCCRDRAGGGGHIRAGS